MSHHVVVVDLDNTLVKLDVDWGALRRRLAELARQGGIETQDPGIRPLLNGARLPGMESVRAEMEDVLTQAEVAGASGPVNEALKAWLEGLPDSVGISVLSLNSREAVHRALELSGLDGRVAHIVGREDVTHGKPDPEGMRLLAERHGVGPQQMLLVGDAESDRLAAERAGADFRHVEQIGVAWRPRSSSG